MIQRIRAIVDHQAFQILVIAVIVLNAGLIGVETSAAIMKQHGHLLHVLNWTIQLIFIVEIALRLLSYLPRPGRFFRDGWNLFDFFVVAFSLLPVAGPFAGVARLARVLRLARLVSVSDQLRLIVATMLRSILSLSHVVVLLALLLYVYAVLGYYSFHKTDPEHWGSLGRCILSVFQMVTLEGWVEMQRAVIVQHPFAWIYFSSFIIVAVFVVVNLFIAVVLNNLEEVKAEQNAADDVMEPGDVQSQIAIIRKELERLEHMLRQAPGKI